MSLIVIFIILIWNILGVLGALLFLYLNPPLVEKFDHSGCTLLTRISSKHFDVFWEYTKKLKLNLVLAVLFVLVFVVESTETEVSNVRPVVTVSAECVVFLLWMSFIFSYDVPHFLCCYTRVATLGKWLHYFVLFQVFCSLKRSVKNISHFSRNWNSWSNEQIFRIVLCLPILE